MVIFNEYSEYVDICSKEEASARLNIEVNSMMTDKILLVDLRDRVIGSDPTLVLWEKTPVSVYSYTLISLEFDGILASVGPETPFIYHPYKSSLPKVKAIATAIVLLVVFLGGFVWAPWSEPVIAETVQVAGYKSLSELPDNYLSLCPKLFDAVKFGKDLSLHDWNEQVELLMTKIALNDIYDKCLIDLCLELLIKDDLEPDTTRRIGDMLTHQIKFDGPKQ